MGTLRYGPLTCSLDGYITDAEGRIDWSAPTVERHEFVNDLVRDVAAFVMGRRMWETMRVWDSMPAGGEPVEDEFAAIWRAAAKIVCSDTLTRIDSPGVALEGRLTAERMAEIVDATRGVVEVSGPTTAAAPWRAGLVDEALVIVVPQLLGGGVRAFPDRVRMGLTLSGEHRFADGTVYLRYSRG